MVLDRFLLVVLSHYCLELLAAKKRKGGSECCFAPPLSLSSLCVLSVVHLVNSTMSDQRDTEHSNTAPAGADEDMGTGTRGYAFFPSPSSSAESSSAPEDSTIGGNERGNEGAHVNDEGHGADGGSQQNDDDQNGGNERQDSGGSSTPQVRTPRGRRSEATSEEDKEKLRKLEEDMKKLEDGKCNEPCCNQSWPFTS